MKKSKINFVIFLIRKKLVSASCEYELNLYPTLVMTKIMIQ